MTKAGALNKFWSGFGLKAYNEASVPTGKGAPSFPYITYETSADSFGEKMLLNASVWYRENTWVNANAKVQEISDTIGRGGVFLPCDGGALWIQRGTPFSHSMGDENDDMIRRNLLNIEIEFLTEN